MSILYDVLDVLGFLFRAIAFLLLGYGIARFVLDAYVKANWQVQVALVLGFFALLVGLTAYASPDSAGAFALGAGIVFFRSTTSAIPPETRPEPK